MWNPNPSIFIANALSPAQIVSVELNEEEQVATVVVPDRQLSLAIGKEGQNARLAAKLTGWRIDIKSASVVEAEKLAAATPETEVAEEALAEILSPLEETLASAGTQKEAVKEPLPATPEEFIPPEAFFAPQAAAAKSELRFAEDILVPSPPKPAAQSAKSKKKKKSGRGKESAEDGIKLKRAHRGLEFTDEDESYE